MVGPRARKVSPKKGSNKMDIEYCYSVYGLKASFLWCFHNVSINQMKHGLKYANLTQKKPSYNVGIGGRVGRWGWGISGTKTDTEQSHEGILDYIKVRQRIQDFALPKEYSG